MTLRTRTVAFLAAVPANQYPYLTEMVTDHAMRVKYDEGADFQFGLSLILDGLERVTRGNAR
jgi:Tetracyclin repressor-like, C-terminal domain